MMTAEELEKKISQAEANLQRKLDWIGRFDTRIAFTTGFSIAMLAVLVTASAAITHWSSFLYLIFGLTFALLLISLLFVCLSQYPSTSSSNSSLIYFVTISKLTSDEFKTKFKQTNSEGYLNDLLDQTHINSQILTKKFSRLKASIILMLISALPWLIAIYLSKIYFK